MRQIVFFAFNALGNYRKICATAFGGEIVLLLLLVSLGVRRVVALDVGRKSNDKWGIGSFLGNLTALYR